MILSDKLRNIWEEAVKTYVKVQCQLIKSFRSGEPTLIREWNCLDFRNNNRHFLSEFRHWGGINEIQNVIYTSV